MVSTPDSMHQLRLQHRVVFLEASSRYNRNHEAAMMQRNSKKTGTPSITDTRSIFESFMR